MLDYTYTHTHILTMPRPLQEASRTDFGWVLVFLYTFWDLIKKIFPGIYMYVYIYPKIVYTSGFSDPKNTSGFSDPNIVYTSGFPDPKTYRSTNFTHKSIPARRLEKMKAR